MILLHIPMSLVSILPDWSISPDSLVFTGLDETSHVGITLCIQFEPSRNPRGLEQILVILASVS